MTPDQYPGRIAAFYVEKSAVVRCVPIPGAVLVVGEILEAKPAGMARGQIPTLSLRIKGRSGRIATACLVENHVRTFTTWAEALEYAK